MQLSPHARRLMVGCWFYRKYKERAKNNVGPRHNWQMQASGTYIAALQLRKQGAPLWLALMVLT